MDLRDFIATLEDAGELRRVRAEVDPVLEITEIADRVVKRGGPALLFERVRGSSMPVLINGFGTDRRMALALGREPDVIGAEAAALLKPKPPRSVSEALELARKYRDVVHVPPKIVGRGACQERVWRGDEVDLTRIPVLKCWPEDAGRFITLPLVFTKDPETRERNIGMYRMQVFDRNSTGMHWQTHKHGRMHFEKARRLGADRLEVAVALGGDPALIYGATAPLPPGIDEVLLAGFIRKRRQRLVKGVTVDLEVPADAEIVLEGYVDCREPFRREGPFGDHTGFYSLADDFPVFHVTAVTMREDAIYPTTVVGVPPQEDGAIGRATERMFLHLLRFQIPELVDMTMPVEGAFHNLMIASLRKAYPGHARKLMMSLWGAGMIALEKTLIVVDEDVNVHDPRAVLEAFERLDPARDVLLVENVPTDTLDHASPVADLGSHVGLDLTRPILSEPTRRAISVRLPTESELQSAAPEIASATAYGNRLVAARFTKTRPGHAADVARRVLDKSVADGAILLLFDGNVDVSDPRMAVFHACANIDPARDLIVERDTIVIDATRKVSGENARPWPTLVEMDEETRSLVAKRWDEYGI